MSKTTCPKCGSDNLIYLPWLGQIWECKDCGYRGALVLVEEEAKKDKTGLFLTRS